MVVFPIEVSNQWLGLITGQSRMPLDLTENDVRHIKTLVDQAGAVAKNLQLVESIRAALATSQQRATELEIAAQVSAAASTNLNMDELLRDVAELTKQSFN